MGFTALDLRCPSLRSCPDGRSEAPMKRTTLALASLLAARAGAEEG